VILKFHSHDDIFWLQDRGLEDGIDIRAWIPGGFVEPGDTIRLTAPLYGVDSRVKVLRSNRTVNRDGDVATIDGEFVD
jgi:hypothetical protein